MIISYNGFLSYLVMGIHKVEGIDKLRDMTFRCIWKFRFGSVLDSHPLSCQNLLLVNS